jgi:hypothetical protein
MAGKNQVDGRTWRLPIVIVALLVAALGQASLLTVVAVEESETSAPPAPEWQIGPRGSSLELQAASLASSESSGAGLADAADFHSMTGMAIDPGGDGLVPEPAALAVLLVGLAAMRKRRREASASA